MLKLLRYVAVITTLVAISIVGMTGCTSQKSVDDSAIVATWGDTAMTVEQFKHKMYVRHRNEPTAQKQTMDERMRILEEYVIRDTKILEGYRLGFDQREDIKKAYQDALERKSTELLYNAKIRDPLITEKMLKDYYEHDQYEVRCRHILVALNPTMSPEDTLAAFNKINEAYEKAKSGESFIKLVDRYSEDESIDRAAHGDLGFFRWGKMVDEFQEAAWSLKEGGISKPVRTRYGYHIIKLIEKRPTTLQAETSHILVSVGKISRTTTAAETTLAYERAMEILKKASKKGADFAQLARQYSEDKNTWVNGYVGLIPRGSMPKDYWNAVFEMEIGEVAGPIRSYKGYHIIKLHDIKTEAESLDDPEVRSRMYSKVSRLHADSIRARTDAFIEKMKSDMQMKYDENVVNLIIKKLSDKSAPQNMNLFSSFTMDERKLNVVNDVMGGLKIQDLVDQYGDHRAPPMFDGERQTLIDMIEVSLMPKYLSKLAREEGFEDHPEAIEEAKKAIANAMLPEVEREVVFNKAAPTEDEIKAYYEENLKEKYTTPAKATIYEVMVDDEKKAQQFYTMIKNGEDIAKVARRHTMRQEAKRKGGTLGPFTEDEYGAVSREAFKLKPGELAGPIKVGGDYSVIKLREKTPQRVDSYDEVRQQIESDIRFEAQKGMKKAWEEELVKKYNVTYYESVVRNVWPLLDPLPESMEAERKQLKKDRQSQAKIISAENKIKIPVTPGQTQEIVKDGKKYTIEFGEPQTASQRDKDKATKGDQPKLDLQMKSKGK